MAGRKKRSAVDRGLSDKVLPEEMSQNLAAPSAAADDGLLTGQLLIAMPAMNTPHFNQAVIYLCAHTPEGAMGIVLNRPLSTPSFDDLLEQLDVAPVPPVRRIELCRGGPGR